MRGSRGSGAPVGRLDVAAPAARLAPARLEELPEALERAADPARDDTESVAEALGRAFGLVFELLPMSDALRALITRRVDADRRG